MTTDPLLTLHQLFSPSFPVGAFAYSHGLETLVQEGRISTAAQLQGWLEAVLEHGAGWSDAVLLAQVAQGADAAELAALATALTPSAERRLETVKQGEAFASTVSDLWQVNIVPAPYPVAVGQAVRALDLPLLPALQLYLQAFAANLAAAGIRLVPLGQTEGQGVIRALSPLCEALAERAMTASLDEIGGFAPLSDIASQRHETLYSRIFRS
ncbi:urease accessory protein UreF [Salipiger mangrovisoli]|uniref:Urease accessory protein UreF n=1 Tax=Salipiger mangrovisoli TaxID=2865933 RepID=A0ABR9X787_9RHOB|nr:urease accessory UreF family protein [Salipiger mangrovisoli]MBE9639463.1 urease accessory protein UreF [Salipiger mangrovisoli]